MIVRSLLFALTLCFPSVLRAQSPAELDSVALSGDHLRNELFQANHAFFRALFAECAADQANAFLTADVEFYDDRTGRRSGNEVRSDFERLAANCPATNGVRRILLRESVEVYPIRGFGAMQLGIHHFVEDGAETSTIAKFVIVWQRVGGAWRMSRVMSVDHQSVPAADAEALRTK